ncbi:Uma2 family endonuclease [Halomicronema hongdechloris]|uniref:Uma2 family endonuclease n=1 Tax=Halomicronema hongdechloris TaxID=1209493 RepID=UPI00211B41C9|nr:Uma2 family endonuclease [Halomicronema hongdechloris]
MQDYWICDRFTQHVEIYRRQNAQLVRIATLLPDDELTSPLLPEFRCLVENLFK